MAVSLEQAMAPRVPVVLNHCPVKAAKAWREMNAEIDARHDEHPARVAELRGEIAL